MVLVDSNDEAAALSVRDYGMGLKPGEAAMVFNRFWRADPSRARQTGGTGLGLAISREIVAAHGGTISAGEDPRGHCRFEVRLPRDSDNGAG